MCAAGAGPTPSFSVVAGGAWYALTGAGHFPVVFPWCQEVLDVRWLVLVRFQSLPW